MSSSDGFAREVARLLEAHLSTINARGVMTRALKRHGLDEGAFRPTDLKQLVPTLERSVRLFVEEAEREQLIASLWDLSGGAPVAQESRVAVHVEADVATARGVARDLCVDAGASGFVAQRAATAVSELARNIVAYTPGGSIRMTVELRPVRCVRIVARDDGSGIADVEHVLSGDYRSRTGMGLGLRGIRRIASRFEIDTGAAGTTVTAEVKL